MATGAHTLPSRRAEGRTGDILDAVNASRRGLRRLLPPIVALIVLACACAGSVAQPLPADDGPLQRLLVAPPQGIGATAYAGDTRLYVSGQTLWRLTPEGRPLRVARLPESVAQLEASPEVD